MSRLHLNLNYVQFRCAQTDVTYLLLKIQHQRNDGWMLWRFRLTFMNSFTKEYLELMYYSSLNPKLVVIYAFKTYMQPCNLSKRCYKLVLLSTTEGSPCRS